MLCAAAQLYKNLVDTTLRFVIEQVGGVEGVYGEGDALQENFLARRTAGNVVEMLGIVAFRASPVWVLAALADVCGAGRQLIPEIADALKEEGLLEKDAQVTSVDQMLNGLERTSSRLAATINTPPLDMAGLRAEWEAIRTEARTIQPGAFPRERRWRDVDAVEDGIGAARAIGVRDDLMLAMRPSLLETRDGSTSRRVPASRGAVRSSPAQCSIITDGRSLKCERPATRRSRQGSSVRTSAPRSISSLRRETR